jgi:hypothetical protein
VAIVFPLAGITLDEFAEDKEAYIQAIAATVNVTESQVSVNATERVSWLLLRRLQSQELDIEALVATNSEEESDSVVQLGGGSKLSAQRVC